jgi:hypothetical protein
MWPAKVDVEIASVVSEWVGVVQIPRRFGCRGLCFTSVARGSQKNADSQIADALRSTILPIFLALLNIQLL